MAVSVSVTVTQVREDGSQAPVDGELAAALAGPVEQFSSMVAWAAQDAGGLDHGEREKVIAESGRELQRRLLEATFTVDSAREQRIAQVTSAAGIRHGTERSSQAGRGDGARGRGVGGGDRLHGALPSMRWLVPAPSSLWSAPRVISSRA